MEASAKIPAEKREITIRIAEKRGQFIILVENVFEGASSTDRGKFLSSKAKGRKGIGIASVCSVAEKYNGETEFYTEGNRFYSEVYIPVHRRNI